MDELEYRRRLKAYHADPVGEIIRTLDESTRLMMGTLERHRRKSRRSFLRFVANLQMLDLLTVLVILVVDRLLRGSWMSGYRVFWNVILMMGIQVAIRSFLAFREWRSK